MEISFPFDNKCARIFHCFFYSYTFFNVSLHYLFPIIIADAEIVKMP